MPDKVSSCHAKPYFSMLSTIRNVVQGRVENYHLIIVFTWVVCKLPRSERASIHLFHILWDGLPDCALPGGTKLVDVTPASGLQQQS